MDYLCDLLHVYMYTDLDSGEISGRATVENMARNGHPSMW